MLQYSDSWWAARLGKATASKISDIMAKTKSGYSASRKNYEAALIAERLTGISPPSFTNAAMQWGTDNEEGARDAYIFETGNKVEEVGFIDHPLIPMSGASPDGLIDGGVLEIKAPNTATHMETLLNKKIPKKYQCQMAWQIACCEGATFGDFVSYDPRLPDSMSLVIIRYEPDADYIAEMEAEVSEFIRDCDIKLNKLREMYP